MEIKQLDFIRAPSAASLATAQGTLTGDILVYLEDEKLFAISIGATLTRLHGAYVGAALTNSTGGSAAAALAAGVGCQTLIFYVEAAALANGDVLTNYVPGYKFKILKFDARCAKPVTTGAKAASLNLEIQTTDLTGGVIALAGAYAQGAAQAGSAVTAANTGSATDSFSIEASGVTAFVEGAFWLLVEIQNMDVADAAASLAQGGA